MRVLDLLLFVQDRCAMPPSSDVQALLAAWSLGDLLSLRRPATGSVHRTLLLTTTAGSYALRAYRYAEREAIAREHALIAYAAARGIPAIAPFPLGDGQTILERDAHFYALFPLASGRQYDRSALGPQQIHAMGDCLARIHLAMRDFPAQRLARRSRRQWSKKPPEYKDIERAAG
jgi:homoserine kinase type II